MVQTVHLAGDNVYLPNGWVVQRCMICGLQIRLDKDRKEKFISGTWIKNVGRGKFLPIIKDGRALTTNFLSFTSKEIPKHSCIRKVLDVK